MAESGGGDGNTPKKPDPREEKIRALRERQADERLRRLEELKKHALEAQQLREQKEIERRKRMDDLRVKDNERRMQVEGRKKQIWEAEQERREAILRKNQEREARVDLKRRNERSSIVFAFGSSTPRLLENSDSMVSSYWGPRRASSTANLRLFPATSTTTVTNATPRRPSDRDQENGKKRAASAGGLYRNPSDDMTTSMYEVLHWSSTAPVPKLSLPSTPYGPLTQSPNMPYCAEGGDDAWGVPRVGRRKTDLMPTTPSPRDNVSRPGSGSRSLARTPGDVTPSRPGSVMSQSSILSASTLTPRLRSAPRRPRPSSIHVTGVSKDKILSPSDDKPKLKENKVPPVKPIITKKQIQNKNEEIKKLQQHKDEVKQANVNNSNNVDENGKDSVKKANGSKSKKKEPVKTSNKPQEPDIKQVEPVKMNGAPLEIKQEPEKSEGNKIPTPEKPTPDSEKEILQEEVKQINGDQVKQNIESNENLGNVQGLLVDISDSQQVPMVPSPATPAVAAPPSPTQLVQTAPLVDLDEPAPSAENQPPVQAPSNVDATDGNKPGNVMTRSRITTEEEAKAVLAERRRQAREQAEREAELERQRLAREEAEEEERLRKEEEEQRLAEEEQLRLIEEARKVEEQRLMLAIQEAQKREEEEKEKRRLEEVARLEKEEADRLAREEAEKQRLEMVERLKKEEEERQARRKRVEAIMKRTRTTAPSNANKADCEKGEEDRAEHEKDESKGNLEAFLHGERVSADKSLTNGQSSHKPAVSNMNEDSPPNGLPTSGIANEDCVNSNSPLSTPLIAFQGKKETPVPTDLLA